MTLDHILEKASDLSFTAQSSIALNIVERYFKKIGFKHPQVDEFFAHLWEFPIIGNSEKFSSWEARRGDLVDFGLTDDLPDDLEECLAHLPINEEELFKIVEAPVEILWGNFFNEPNKETSLGYLKSSLELAEREGLIFPNIATYQQSKWIDQNGWGKSVDAETRDCWRA